MWIECITIVVIFTFPEALGLATDVRLAHGIETDLKPYEGILEVDVNGTWGPVARHAIDDVTAKTICRMLGYGHVGFLVERFQYPGIPLLKTLKCFGTETSIAECIQKPGFKTQFTDSPGIHCFDHVFTGVRMIGGTSPNSGSVQVKMDGRWGSVCDYNSACDVMTASEIDRVICRTLGYEMNDPKPQRGRDSNVTHLSWVDLDTTTCNGSETNFNQCKFQPVTMYQPDCYATRAVACITNLNGACTSDAICAAIPNAVCRHKTCVCGTNYKLTKDGKCASHSITRPGPSLPRPGPSLPRPGASLHSGIQSFDVKAPGRATNVRLAHSGFTALFKPYEGVVEVEVNGTWGTILHHGIDNVTAKTICRILGYGNVGFLIKRFLSPGKPLLNRLKCFGNESSIVECTQEPSNIRTLSHDSPGVHCFDHVFTDVRLIGGSSPNSGTIQVKMDGRWGLVCDYNSLSYAPEIDKVICRTIGYDTNHLKPQRGDKNNNTHLSWIDMETTACDGSETHFNQCKFSPVILYQPGCHETRAVTCISNLNGACTSDAICAAVPNAVCRHKTCVCGTNYKQTKDGKCASHSITRPEPSLPRPGPSLPRPGASLHSGIKSFDVKARGKATNVRLAHSEFSDILKPYEGVVEVEVNGTWGTILHHGIDDVTAKTICRILGYGNVGFLIKRFLSPGKPLLNQLKCFGNESSIVECTQEPSNIRTLSHDSPGVHCFDHVFTDVRLIGGSSPNSGTIQVKMDGRWGLVCDYNSLSYAPEIDKVICRTLGYDTNHLKPQRGDKNNDTQLSWIDMVTTACDGSETHFSQCKFSPVILYQPGCHETRAVTCISNLNGACTSDAICAAIPNVVCRHQTCVCGTNYKQTKDGKCASHSITRPEPSLPRAEPPLPRPGASLHSGIKSFDVKARGKATNVRLAHSEFSDILKPYEGVVEVEVNGTWGTILHHGIDDVTAKTICRILGYGNVGFLIKRFLSPGKPLLNQLKCFGNESSIVECTQEPSNIRTLSHDSPGVHCFDHVFTDVRLIGGSFPNSGTVQVKMDGRWGLVCDYNSLSYAPEIDKVICRTLGYDTNHLKPQRGDKNNDTHLSWIEMVTTACDGSETHFNQCKFDPVILYQPGCHETRAVTCISNLNGKCTSDSSCVAVPNAVCKHNKCVCKDGHKQANEGICAPFGYIVVRQGFKNGR